MAEVGVSAVPRPVTGMMLGNLAEGVSTLAILARRLDATLDIIDLGTVRPSTGCRGCAICNWPPVRATSWSRMP